MPLLIFFSPYENSCLAKKKVYLLQRSLFAHKLAEGESAIIVAIHSLEEVLNLGPAGEPQLLYFSQQL